MAAPRPVAKSPFPDPGTVIGGALSGIPGGGLAGPLLQGNLPSISNPLKPINEFKSVASFLANPQSWVRIGEGLVGVLLIGVGISAMLRSTPVGQAAGSAAKFAATKGVIK